MDYPFHAAQFASGCVDINVFVLQCPSNLDSIYLFSARLSAVNTIQDQCVLHGLRC